MAGQGQEDFVEHCSTPNVTSKVADAAQLGLYRLSLIRMPGAVGREALCAEENTKITQAHGL